jgi:hypothetical protein
MASHSALFKIILKNKIIDADVQTIKNSEVTAITVYDLT